MKQSNTIRRSAKPNKSLWGHAVVAQQWGPGHAVRWAASGVGGHWVAALIMWPRTKGSEKLLLSSLR